MPRRAASRLRLAQRLVPAAVLGAQFWSLGLPVYVDAALFALAALLALITDWRKLACLAGGMFVAMAVTETAVRRVLDPRGLARAYTAPAEKYAEGGRYRPGVNQTFHIPYGDLAAMDPTIAAAVGEPRVTRFRTDRAGWRNDADAAGGDLVLIGDSFIAGASCDQDDTLANVLRREHGLAAYAMGYPGDPQDYVCVAEQFLREVSDSAQFVFFIFEGNDFVGPPSPSLRPGLYDRVKLRFSRAVEPVFRTTRYLFNLSRHVERRIGGRLDARIQVMDAGGRSMAFYTPYLDCALAASLPLRPLPRESAAYSHVRAVVFIPTKFRVYSDLLQPSPARRPIDPPPGCVAVRQWFEPRGIPVIDLTGPLKARARELLPQGGYVYWRDDTHWNGEGVRVAAGQIAALLGRKD